MLRDFWGNIKMGLSTLSWSENNTSANIVEVESHLKNYLISRHTIHQQKREKNFKSWMLIRLSLNFYWCSMLTWRYKFGDFCVASQRFMMAFSRVIPTIGNLESMPSTQPVGQCSFENHVTVIAKHFNNYRPFDVPHSIQMTAIIWILQK